MTDKQMINEIDISKCEFCEDSKYCYIYSGTADFKWMCKENEDCQIKNLLLQLARKEQECEEKQKTAQDAINKLCAEKSALHNELDQLKAENEELIRRITKIFACLIKANRTNKIVDTLWVDNITTLWDYVAQTLGIEGDQVQIEEQILQKISECEVEND